MRTVATIRSVADLPAIAMPTDLSRVPDPVGASRKLPAGAAVILRDTGHPDRLAVGIALRISTRAQGQLLLVAGDPELADALNADGLHVPERMIGSKTVRQWRRADPGRLMSAACHSLAALRRAERAGANMVLLSPVFPTASHPGGRVLGLYRAAALAAATALPVLAMGGMERSNANRLPPAFSGFAAIGMFANGGGD
ncbi:MAG: thiamine phosphate synthase [Minwuia sp.]|nr:thiamine phosphate synthase [Minwuia sp.]